MKLFKNLVFLVYRGENKIRGKKWRHGKMKKLHFEILISNERLEIKKKYLGKNFILSFSVHSPNFKKIGEMTPDRICFFGVD